VSQRTPFFLFLPILLAGCSSAPDTYAPPVQRQPLHVPPANALGYFASMSDPLASSYIVKDVSGATEGDGWRWAYRRPEFRFFVPVTEGLKFTMDFSIPERMFREIGPVTISFFLNGTLFDKVAYEKGGHLQYQKPVPAGLLRNGENFVAVEPDKVWVSKNDGAALSFNLSRIGFTE
jgi:hypothetical protein